MSPYRESASPVCLDAFYKYFGRGTVSEHSKYKSIFWSLFSMCHALAFIQSWFFIRRSLTKTVTVSAHLPRILDPIIQIRIQYEPDE